MKTKSDDTSVAELLELAYRRAMTGDLDGATSALTQVRELTPLRQGSAESMEVMLLEGVILAFEGNLEPARDRLRRVVALGPLVPHSNAPTEAWAWLSIFAYYADDDDGAVDALVQAVAQPHRARPRTILRASLNGAWLGESAGLPEVAAAWLAAARLAAPRCGVPALMGVVVFSLAAVRVSRAAIGHLRTPTTPDDARSLLMLVQSTVHYDAARGYKQKADAHDMMRAIVLRLAGRAAEALPIVERLLGSDTGLRPGERVAIRLEHISCRLLTDPSFVDAAEADFLRAYEASAANAGERADALFLLAELDRRLGGGMHDNLRQRANESLALHEQRMADLADRLCAQGLTTVPPAWASP
jgi:tetratricopeptide (TPR) repeat protein